MSKAYRLLESGKPQDALALVKRVKALEPKNIYVLAFEKQLEQFISFEIANSLTDEQRSDIMESIPGIIERAAEGAAVEILTAERDESAASKARDDKNAALEWLKDQYFQHAHEYVQNEQYEHALAEIRRVYIIDTENKTALEFEKRIEHLISLKTQPPPPAPPVPPALRLVTKESLREFELSGSREETESEKPEQIVLPPLVDTTAATDELEKILVKTDEWSTPAAAEPAEHKRGATTQQPGKHHGVRPAITVVALILVIAIGASVFMLWTRGQEDKRAEARRSAVISTAQPETFLGPQTTVDEQTITIESSSDEAANPTSDEESGAASATTKESTPKTEPRSRKRSSPEKSTTQKKGSASSRSRDNSTSFTADRRTEQAQVPSGASVLAPPSKQESTPSENTSITMNAVPDKAAEIVKLARVELPQNSSLDQYQGQVVVQVQIDPKGRPTQTKVLSSTNEYLVTPVIEAVMKSKFSPAQTSSGPVSSWMTIPFRLKH